MVQENATIANEYEYDEWGNEYTKAMKDSLKNAGLSDDEVMEATQKAIKQRVEFCLNGGDAVPRISSRINKKRQKCRMK